MGDQSFEMDIDRERVLVDGEWLSVGDLTQRIREKIQAGDFRVARLSTALEQVEGLLGSLQAVSCQVTHEVMQAFNKIADHEQVPLSRVLRRALVHYLASEEAAGRLFEANRARG